LGFRGVVASDDLEMGALRRFGGPGASAVRAARAGHDLILCCHRADWQRDVHRALTAAHRAGELKTADLDKSVERIEALRGARRPRFAPGAPRPEKGGDALADRVARAGVRARIGETSLPLPLSSRTLVLFPRLRPLARKIFIEETVQHPESLFPRGPRLRTLPIDPAPGDIARARAAALRAGTVVFFCYDAHLQSGNRRLLKTLENTGVPLVLVTLRDPYDMDVARPATTVVTATGLRRCQIEAARHAVFGQ
jgi:beta-N-acetylhexosaminidase